MRNASRARKMRNHLDQFKRSAMRLENGITIQTLKKTRRGIYLSLFVRVFPNAYLREMNEDFCKPKSHKSLPFFALCLWLIPFFGLPCLSFFIKLLLLTTLYISIAQIQYKWTLSLSLSLSLFVRVLLLRRWSQFFSLQKLNDIVLQLQRVANPPDATRRAQRILRNRYEIIRPTDVYFPVRHGADAKHDRFFIFLQIVRDELSHPFHLGRAKTKSHSSSAGGEVFRHRLLDDF